MHCAHYIHPQHSIVQPLLLTCSPPMSTWSHGLLQGAEYQISPEVVRETTVLFKLSYRSCQHHWAQDAECSPPKPAVGHPDVIKLSLRRAHHLELE